MTLEGADQSLVPVISIGDRHRETNRRTAELAGLDLAGYGWPA
jgi:hypothetical protein